MKNAWPRISKTPIYVRCLGFLEGLRLWKAIEHARSGFSGVQWLAFTLSVTSPSVAAVSPDLEANPRIIKILESVLPNRGLNLGRASVIGDFNDVARRYLLHETGPQRRDYSLKMVWAPERKRALFAGANHRTPHRLNDVWEFDLAAMTWILLYSPDPSRGYQTLGKNSDDVELRDGVLVTPRGGPAVIGHTWSGLTYDSGTRKMLFMNAWVTDQKKVVRELGGDPSLLHRGPPLWSFTPETKRWSFVKAASPAPPGLFGGMLEYVPELGGSIWHMNNWLMQATWLFDGKENRWTNLNANKISKDFSSQAPTRELVGYYDPKRKIIVVRQGAGTFHFDVKTRSWSKVDQTDVGPQDVPKGYDGYNVFYNDPRSGMGLLVDFKSQSIWAYDPDRIAWKKVEVGGDAMPSGKRSLAYVDPHNNVLVVIDDRDVWVFRYENVRD